MRLKYFILALAILGISAVAGLAAFPDISEAAVFTVNTSDDVDDGVCDVAHCSLREAINAANATAGTDTIAFDIPGAGPHTIQPLSALPTITDPVTVDGYTQPGASPNTNGPGLGLNTVLMIELDGSSAGAGTNGLAITAGDSTVRGLVINRFTENGIQLQTIGGNVVEGSFIGTDVTGTAALGNGFFGLIITSGAPGNTIGGITRATRNIISGNSFSGVTIVGSDGNIVKGNFIGTTVDGRSAIGNLDGVFIQNSASNNQVGGEASGEGNVISGNTGSGISLSSNSAGNRVQGNFIGTDVTSTVALGNSGHGASLSFSASNNTIGGTGDDEGNIIAFNAGDGVSLEANAGTSNAILLNTMFSNVGLGIDLNNDGVTPNDPDDADASPNNLQNFPDIASAVFNGSNGDLRIEYSVDSTTTNSTYPLRVEFFIADADGEEGEIYVGSDIYPDTDAQATRTVDLTMVAEFVSGGDVIVATATDDDGNTSEFSSSEPIAFTCNGLPATLVGTSGDDNLEGTSADDVILGLNGHDVIAAREGEDSVCAGMGDDIVAAGDGEDWVEAQQGDDMVHGGDGADELFGNSGDDQLSGAFGDDIIDCGSGTDYADGGDDSDEVLEADIISANCEESAPDVENGPPGGGVPPDKTTCRGAEATILGTIGDDFLIGTPGNDVMVGRDGHDVMLGLGGKDLMCGGPGNDMLVGGTGRDRLDGDRGHDMIAGGNSDDGVKGGSGRDIIKGDGGDDHISCGSQADFVDGGNGVDSARINCETQLNIELPSCDLSLAYSGDTLTIDFVLGTREPATWIISMFIPGVDPILLLTTPIPAIDPPVSFSIPIPEFPSVGTVGILNLLITPKGISCTGFDSVDTGTASLVIPSAEEIRELFPSVGAVSADLSRR